MCSVNDIKLGDTKNLKTSLCSGCLSSDRKLKPLGEKINIFCMLVSDTYLKHQSDISLCWECMVMLRKVELFKEKVEHAQTALNFHLNTSIIPEPLTTLATTQILSLTTNDHNDLDVEVKVETVDIESDIIESDIIKKTVIYVPDKSELNNHSFEPDATYDSDMDNIDQQDDCVYNISKDSLESIDAPLKIRLHKRCSETRNTHDETDSKQQKLTTESKSAKDKTKSDKVEDKDTDFIPNEEQPKKTSEKATKKKYRTSRGLRHKYIKVICKDYENFTKHVKTVKVDVKEIVACKENDRNSEIFRDMIHKCEKCVEPLLEHKVEKHSALHVKNARRKFSCDVCEQTFLSVKDKRIHTSKHKCVYQCLVCGIRMCSRLLMRRHLKYHSTKVQCTRCKDAFSSKQDAVQHYRASHTKFICDYCGKTHNSRSSLSKHITKHQSWHCKLCNKSFKNYDRHLKIHHTTQVTEQTFCVECNIRFKNIYAYKEHIYNSLAHNAEKFEKKKQTTYPCPDCSKVYRSGNALRDHHDFVHKGQSRHTCPYCNKQLQTKTRLHEHTRIHLGLKPAKDKMCNVCGRGFATNRTLIHHMRTHTGEKPHQCLYCDASFAQKVAMNSHMKSIHLKAAGGGAV